MINILVGGNRKVFDGILCELISIINRTKSPITYYIFTANIERLNKDFIPISIEQANFLDEIARRNNPENRVILKDVTKLYEKEFLASPNESAYCTPYTLLRLLADMVPDIPDKILYLDIDMMIANDLSILYDIDIDNYEYAAVKEKYGCWAIRPDYINAGMLLLNMKKIRETKLLEKARDKIKKKKMLFADQDAIFWSTTKKKIIPRKFNEQSKFDRKDTVVCHFCKRLLFKPKIHTTNFKQWHIDKVHEELKCYTFDDDLNEYLKLKQEFDNRIKV